MARLAARLEQLVRRRARVLLQHRRRGQRGRDQARAPLGPWQRRPLRDYLARWARSMAAPSAPSPPPARKNITSAFSRWCRASLVRYDDVAAVETRRHDADGRHPGRADPGRRRRRHAASGLSRAAARAVRSRKNPADLRRGADRDGPHGQAFRLPARRGQAGHHDARQGARRRRADRRDGRQEPRSPRASRRAAHGSTFGGNPDHLRRRGRGARRARAGRRAGKRDQRRRLPARAAARRSPRAARDVARGARPGHDDRHGADTARPRASSTRACKRTVCSSTARPKTCCGCCRRSR